MFKCSFIKQVWF